jgi:S1-C subfamily serine protease
MSHYQFVSMGTNWFPPDNLIIAPGDELMVIGYPLGFYDSLHNYPIVRTGAVASAYPIPFQGKPLFLVDARLAPGTSGSPVITKPSIVQRTSTATMYGTTAVYFLGVNSAEVSPSGTGLNTIWYAKEVKTITDPSFKTATFPQPEAKNSP